MRNLTASLVRIGLLASVVLLFAPAPGIVNLAAADTNASSAQILLQALQSPPPTPVVAITTASTTNSQPAITIPIGISLQHFGTNNAIIPQAAATATAATASTSTSHSSLLQSLLAELKALEAQIATFEGSATPTSSVAGLAPVFTRNLSLHDTGPDVLALQQFLNAHGFPVAGNGPGSSGEETTFFGLATYHALIKYQTTNDLPATGYFGPQTRAFIGGHPAPQSITQTSKTASFTTSNSSSTASTTAAPSPIPTTSTPGFGGGGGGGGGGSTAPAISSISSGRPSATVASITWTTDQSSNSEVVWGTTASYGSSYSSPSLVTSHSVTLASLTPSTTYHYAVVSTNGSGITATSSDQTLTTASVSATDLYTPGPSTALYSSPFYTCTTNYYVSTTGSDSNDGSSAHPWLTLQHADSAGPTAGTCINVEPGTYASGVTINHGGTAATPSGYVVYRCTTLDGCKITESDKGFAIVPPGAQGTGGPGPNYIVIDGFELAASSKVAYGAGINTWDNQPGGEDTIGSHHIWVLNNIVHGYGEAGIAGSDGEYFYFIHNTAYNNANVTCDAQGSGIGVVVPKAIPRYTPTSMDTAYGFKIVVEYNISYDNILTQCGNATNPYDTDGNGIIFDTWDGSGTTFGPYAGSGLAAFNLVYQNGGKGIQVFRNSAATIVIANNTSYENQQDPFNDGAGGEINLNGSADTTVINNISYPVVAASLSDPRCQGVNYTVSPWNLPYACPLQIDASFLAGDYAGSGGTDISVTNTHLSDVFSNNINFGGAPYYGSDGHGNALFDGNTINCSTGLYPNLCNTNPLLNNVLSDNFTLQASSPAIGYGQTQSYLPSQSVDVGAFGTGADTPAVSLIAPTSGATVSGTSVSLTATATDTVNSVSQVQFAIDGANIGSAITSSPYATTWNSTGVSDGTHTLYAVAKNTIGGYATSSISVTVDNTPPVISAIATSSTQTTATITWTTSKAASSTVAYGLTTSYGSASSSANLVTSHSITLTGLTASSTYDFQIQSTDAGGNLATSSNLTFTTATSSTLANGLVGYWSFDTSDVSSTSVTDLSGNGNAGTAAETPTLVTGQMNQAMAFTDGVQQVNVGHGSSLNITGPLSISFWLFPTTTPGALNYGLFEKGQAYQQAGFVAYYGYNSTDVHCGIGNGSGGGNVTSSVGMNLNQWNHIVCVYDGSNFDVYVNGTETGTSTGVAAPASSASDDMYLGSEGLDTGNNFFGDMDEFRIYNRALSPTEITELYQQ